MSRIGRVRRLQLAQLALFVAIGLGCSSYLTFTVVGFDSLADPIEVTVKMRDASGLAPRSPVTYNGVEVGRVESVRLRDDSGGARIVISLDHGVRVPADANAVVAQSTAIALQHLDLRPSTRGPPYLTDGDVITVTGSGNSIPLEQVLTNLVGVLEGVDLDDIGTIAEELAQGVRGLSPRLRQLMDNTEHILTALHRMRPEIEKLTRTTREFLAGAHGSGGRLPQLVAAAGALTAQLRGVVPALWPLVEQTPELARQVVPLLAKNQNSVSLLLANLVTPFEVMRVRTPALNELLKNLPRAFGQLASVGGNGQAHFSLITALGPVCYYDTERRTPNQTAPRKPALHYHCPGGQTHGYGVRGAANAPRPDTPQPQPPAPPTAGSPTDSHSWTSLYVQGARQ